MPADSPVPFSEPMLGWPRISGPLRGSCVRCSVCSRTSRGKTVLDMGCGDGAYRVLGGVCRAFWGARARYLDLARERVTKAGHGANVEFMAPSIDGLPFEEGPSDLCWCAQSLRNYFAEYLKPLAENAGEYLDGAIRDDFDPLADPRSKGYLLDDPDVTVSCVDHLV